MCTRLELYDAVVYYQSRLSGIKSLLVPYAARRWMADHAAQLSMLGQPAFSFMGIPCEFHTGPLTVIGPDGNCVEVIFEEVIFDDRLWRQPVPVVEVPQVATQRPLRGFA
jgi:hypothetical protein